MTQIHKCDNCDLEMVVYPFGQLPQGWIYVLEKGDRYIEWHFCSWKCLLEQLPVDMAINTEEEE